MAKRLAMVIDASKCIDCKGCMVSCKVANSVPQDKWRNWIKPTEPEFGPGRRPSVRFQPGGCMHCEKPTCVSACPTGATYKDADTGEVVIDAALCIGCGNCIPACPYDARYRNPETKKADKCNYCPERRAAGLLPACVDTCPTKARVFGDLNDPDSEASKVYKANKDRVQVVINEKTDTKPNMYYIGSPGNTRWTRPAVVPASMTAMKEAAPLVKGLVGLTGLGVLAMLGRQLFAGSTDKHEEEDRHG